MSRAITIRRPAQFACALLLFTTMVRAQSLLSEVKAEHDPCKRSLKALDVANTAFNSAHDEYTKGLVNKGDEDLETMMKALQECVSSLDTAHKARYYKKAEMDVALLQRRMQSLLDDISVQQRGWAEYTQRKLEEVHDKLLDGVMRK